MEIIVREFAWLETRIGGVRVDTILFLASLHVFFQLHWAVGKLVSLLFGYMSMLAFKICDTNTSHIEICDIFSLIKYQSFKHLRRVYGGAGKV